jgi:hypothetical protein
MYIDKMPEVARIAYGIILSEAEWYDFFEQSKNDDPKLKSYLKGAGAEEFQGVTNYDGTKLKGTIFEDLEIVQGGPGEDQWFIHGPDVWSNYDNQWPWEPKDSESILSLTDSHNAQIDRLGNKLGKTPKIYYFPVFDY